MYLKIANCPMCMQDNSMIVWLHAKIQCVYASVHAYVYLNQWMQCNKIGQLTITDFQWNPVQFYMHAQLI